jgi:UDP-glucose 4-epimerase
MKKKALVTGGAGFIGSHLADALLKMGYYVIVVDNLSTGRRENIPAKCKFYKIDIVSEKLRSIFTKEKPKVVWHLAAFTDTSVSSSSIRQDIDTNLIGTLNTLKAASQADCQKFIFTSTAAVYGDANRLPVSETATPNPISPYGIGKLTCENYVRIYCDYCGIKFVILRYGNVYGPRQHPKGESGAIPIFINKMLSGQTPYLYGEGNQIRDYTYVDDIIQASLKATAKGEGKIINIATGKGTGTRHLYALIAKFLNFKAAPKFAAPRCGEIKKSILSNAKAKKELNWRPKTDLKTGLYQTIQWWKEKNW